MLDTAIAAVHIHSETCFDLVTFSVYEIMDRCCCSFIVHILFLLLYKAVYDAMIEQLQFYTLCSPGVDDVARAWCTYILSLA